MHVHSARLVPRQNRYIRVFEARGGRFKRSLRHQDVDLSDVGASGASLSQRRFTT